MPSAGFCFCGSLAVVFAVLFEQGLGGFRLLAFFAVKLFSSLLVAVSIRKPERVGYKNSKGSITITRKGYLRIGLIPRSEFSRVACSKGLLYLLLFRELLALGCCCRVGGRSIRHNYTLVVLRRCSLFIFFFFVIWFRTRTRVR